nr:PREDICTED: uncharacterized protein LOC109032909 [Bemisia tabaci]
MFYYYLFLVLLFTRRTVILGTIRAEKIQNGGSNVNTISVKPSWTREIFIVDETSTENTADVDDTELDRKLETRLHSDSSQSQKQPPQEIGGSYPWARPVTESAGAQETRGRGGFLHDDEKAVMQACCCCCCAHWLNKIPSYPSWKDYLLPSRRKNKNKEQLERSSTRT